MSGLSWHHLDLARFPGHRSQSSDSGMMLGVKVSIPRVGPGVKLPDSRDEWSLQHLTGVSGAPVSIASIAFA